MRPFTEDATGVVAEAVEGFAAMDGDVGIQLLVGFTNGIEERF